MEGLISDLEAKGIEHAFLKVKPTVKPQNHIKEYTRRFQELEAIVTRNLLRLETRVLLLPSCKLPSCPTFTVIIYPFPGHLLVK